MGRSGAANFASFGVVYVDGSPCRTILINHLEWVRDSFDPEGSLPSRHQFFGALRRGRHREDETTLLIWVGGSGRRRSSHLLVGELQALLENLCIGGGFADGWGSTGIMLEVGRKSRFEAGGDHGC